jgi:hypothetical protein
VPTALLSQPASAPARSTGRSVLGSTMIPQLMLVLSLDPQCVRLSGASLIARVLAGF